MMALTLVNCRFALNHLRFKSVKKLKLREYKNTYITDLDIDIDVDI